MLEILLLFTAVLAGFLGSILGLGGGIIIVPVLTLFYHVDIHYAVAASLISIVATSSGAAASYLKDSLTNLRLAVFLEIGTVSGAIIGFLISSFIHGKILFLLFGVMLLFSGILMLRRREDHISSNNHPWSESLKLNGTFHEANGKTIEYKVEHIPLGLFIMFIAGTLSALLGIGSGVLKVLAMDTAMKLPIKVSSATSNFMIGVTASASAGAYLLKGDVKPEIACPVALGIIIGSYFGAKVMMRLPSTRIRQLFVVILTIISVQMIIKGLR
ncbi:MAG: sulfite exporter TauE/SafE family protein [Bdellovibrio sp.]